MNVQFDQLNTLSPLKKTRQVMSKQQQQVVKQIHIFQNKTILMPSNKVNFNRNGVGHFNTKINKINKVLENLELNTDQTGNRNEMKHMTQT